MALILIVPCRNVKGGATEVLRLLGLKEGEPPPFILMQLKWFFCLDFCH
ncbi:MAG: hypothetical protein ACTSPD_20935 [Promethearchaeota archaeon]